MNLAINKEVSDIILYSFKTMLIEIEDMLSSLKPNLRRFALSENINPLVVVLASVHS